MRCPFCDAEKDSLKVIDSRTCEEGRSIRRRRECLNCSKRFTTYERVERAVRLMVVKKDGRRLPWNKEKIISGLERACFKRPVPESEIIRVADEVEDEVFGAYDREVPTAAIGGLVTAHLRRIDQVAYVRFASVYRQFKTLEELIEESRAVLDARRFEDPGQGKLFLDARPLDDASRRGDRLLDDASPASTDRTDSERRPRNGKAKRRAAAAAAAALEPDA